MDYDVRVSKEAEKDLLDICAYVATHDEASAADHVLEKLEQACLTLETLPNRGHVPPELERLQLSDYRELCRKPYRIIYEVAGKTVNVLAVLDGRRDVQDFLLHRLLR